MVLCGSEMCACSVRAYVGQGGDRDCVEYRPMFLGLVVGDEIVYTNERTLINHF